MQVPKTMQDLIDDCAKANEELEKFRADFVVASEKAESALRILRNALLLIGPVYSSVNHSVYSCPNKREGTIVVTPTRMASACEYTLATIEEGKVPA
jgi:hypothetical protein